MGNMVRLEAVATNDLMDQFEEVGREAVGMVVADKRSGETFLLREFNFAHEQQMNAHIKKMNEKLKGPQNCSLLNLIRFEKRELNGFCSTTFKVYGLYEYPQVTLSDEIAARKSDSKRFQEAELWSIFQSCCDGLAELNPAFGLDTSKIFVMPDGSLKLPNNDLICTDHRALVLPKNYYAPEKMANFNRFDDELSLSKQIVFSFGMTLLHSALLKDCFDCYDYALGSFSKGKLENYLEELKSQYSEDFWQTLSSMLQFDQEVRMNLTEISQRIKTTICLEASNQEIQSVPALSDRAQVDELAPVKAFSDITFPIPNKQPLPELNFQRALPPPVSSSFTNKQNLFTDPSLLAMIRKDIQDIQRLKKSSQMCYSVYPQKEDHQKSYNSLSQWQGPPLTALSQQKMNIAVYSMTETHLNQSGGIEKVHPVKNTVSSMTTPFQAQSPHERIHQVNESVGSSGKLVQSHQFEKGDMRKPQMNCHRISYDDGRVYEGTVVNNQKSGLGKLIFQDGAYYEGEFSEDFIQGKGILYYGIGRVAYDGEWIQDQFHGKGILNNEEPALLTEPYNYADFNNVQKFWTSYIGDFDHDNKSGCGTLQLSNGERYEGSFICDSIQGDGIFTNLWGQQISGRWEANVLVEVYDHA